MVRRQRLRVRVRPDPFEAFLPVLGDETFAFLEEEELPAGYRPGDLAL